MPTAQHDTLKQSFIDGGLPKDLTTALLDEYEGNKRRYFLHDYLPAAINGGRFCEVATRILEFRATGSYTPLSEKIEVEKVLNRLDNFGPQLGEMLRVHVIRAIKFTYGIRNTRDNGHVKDGIDPNLQDSTAVVGSLDWVLAEIVRVWHGVTAEEAQDLIAGIVTKEVPLIAVYNGKPVLLRDLKHLDHLLVVLYWANTESVTRADLRVFLPDRITKNLPRVLTTAEKAHWVHLDGEEVFLTPPGRRHVEDNDLLKPV